MRIFQLGGQRLEADLALVGAEVANHAGQNHLPLRIRQTFGHAIAHAGHQRMRGSQVNTNSNASLMRVWRLAGF